jgi:hypothetical protein
MQLGFVSAILSDRTFDRDYAPIPALLASSGLHHHLIRAMRSKRQQRTTDYSGQKSIGLREVDEQGIRSRCINAGIEKRQFVVSFRETHQF